jgi:hypothetical protein
VNIEPIGVLVFVLCLEYRRAIGRSRRGRTSPAFSEELERARQTIVAAAAGGPASGGLDVAVSAFR